jgi:peptide/nickel transport system ATP-binding protein
MSLAHAIPYASVVTPVPPLQARPAGAVLLEARGLTVSAPGRPERLQVLRDVSFTLRAGATLGLVGESGAGKSMLGRVIARHLPDGFTVDAGTLRFGHGEGGADLLGMPAEAHRALLGARIAFIPQEPMTALNPVLTIGQQLQEHLLRLGVAKDEWRERATAMLAEVRIHQPAQVLDKYAFQLSGGMCQRVMIAMAFAGDPQLVVSDEATTALDASTQAHIVTLIRGLQERRGTGVIFVTHDLGLAAHVCDELVVLYAGEMAERGPAKRIFTRSLHPYTQALQRANPHLTGPRRLLFSLPGQMPGISDFPSLQGCRFQPRCAVATEACATAVPAMREVLPGHHVRCVHGAAAPEPLLAADASDATIFHAPRMSDAPFLQVEGLSKVYRPRSGWLRRETGVHAVKDVDLTIAPGEFVGIVGESGSGKSSLARLVMGLETPSEGRILLNGKALVARAEDWERRIASIQMIFQDARSALNPRRRVQSLVTQSMESRPNLHSDRQARARELVADVGLAPDMLTRFPSQMSGGQRQRVNIGRALCDLPQLLVADEIVSGLDVSVQAQILNLLLRIRREHKISLLLISHDLAVVRYLCSRVLVMHQGVVVESGETEAVLANPQHAYTKSLLAAVPPRDLGVRWPQ